MTRHLALKVHEADNVATLFANGLAGGMTVQARDPSGRETAITLLSPVPYGHKIALVDIRAGQEYVKYGESIGIATRDVAKGEHVHVHNLDSQRGRGDLP